VWILFHGKRTDDNKTALNCEKTDEKIEKEVFKKVL